MEKVLNVPWSVQVLAEKVVTEFVISRLLLETVLIVKVPDLTLVFLVALRVDVGEEVLVVLFGRLLPELSRTFCMQLMVMTAVAISPVLLPVLLLVLMLTVDGCVFGCAFGALLKVSMAMLVGAETAM